ncbi:MAG: acetate/propionate family kinase [Rhodobacteraceae bacterium]|jgi:acetate kinase|uniref:Acetate kinase n=1 Tax=Salipiger profundus TaxID=1229727 RepID=A0A1U7DC04_9RHOB|nr:MULTISPECIES: acetate/propionate family kinase [Salipiger]APX25691.1 acetate kinase [Salipiger profundus]MAB06368.1 acetate/propionate family kinase [Paracoccaceae bacterium]GGA04036.1 acetate kinase [Salipiger profundus]SFD55624.1 acetate kinase [Salipiger profundus]
MSTTPVALTLNAGSSSLKFGLYDIAAAPVEMAMGLIENIGKAPRLKVHFGPGRTPVSRDLAATDAADHRSALTTALDLLRAQFPDARASAVGHRVVHGGPGLAEPVVLTPGVMEELRRLSPFAPIHQPHNLAGIDAAMEAFPEALQVACFDTAFHRSHPRVNDIFALPREYYDKGVRRYGFHGLSYDYISGELKRIAPLIHEGRVIVAHLGNGASMCGMIGGRSVASTMGFTALDGLPMGTRTGQIDPGVIFYLVQQEGMSIDEVRQLFYSKSGLLGLSGLSHDMRALEAAGTVEANEAIDYFVFRIRRELGGLAAALGGLDALVFCGGIGENSRLIRERVCEGMGWIGLELDRERNAAGDTVISTDMSRARVMVVPTNEELVIARAARKFLCAQS